MGVKPVRGILILGFLLAQSGGLWAQTSTGFYVFFQKPSTWSEVFLYAWNADEDPFIETFGPWPGERLRSDSIWYQAYLLRENLDGNGGLNLIFHSGRGQQTADLYRQRVGWFAPTEDLSSGDWFDTRPDDPLYELIVQGGQGSGLYRGGSLVTIEADLPEKWNLFVEWAGAGSEFLDDPFSAATQLSMPQFDTEIEAVYRSFATGANDYQAQCGFCHGAEGAGGVGPSFLISDEACPSCQDSATLKDRIIETMPLGNVKACEGHEAGDCAYEVSHFIRNYLNKGHGVGCEPDASNTLARRLRLLTKDEYWASVQDLLGFSMAFPRDVFWPEPPLVRGFDNNSDAGVITDRHLQAMMQLGSRVVEFADLSQLNSEACAGQADCIVKNFGLRAFRRPLDAAEKQRYLSMLNAAGDRETGKRQLIYAMLLSPHFLYRSELGEWDSDRQLHFLSDFEIASLISYSTIGSMPDEALLQAASNGLLQDASQRQAHVKRLLDLDRSQAYIEKFAGLWLGIEMLLSSTRDDPSLTPEIRRQMIEESKAFVSQNFLDSSQAYADFYTADYTFTRPELANFYGLPDSNSPGLSKRQLDPNRSGILGHGSILASQSSFQEASPIKRGVFVRGQLLCQDLPSPPANVDTTIPPPIPGQSIRDRLERHQSQGEQADGANSCFSCHRFIDSIGFGFESFDLTGKYREVYEHIGGVPVDASGSVLNIEGLTKPSYHEFETLAELGQILADSQSAKDCMVTQLYRYTYGVSEQRSDQCSMQDLGRAFAAGGYSVRALLEAFSGSDFFIYRH